MKKHLFCLAGFLSWLVALSTAAEPVHVAVNDFEGKKHGAGFSVKKSSECYVITPLHVVKDASYEAITVTDRAGNTSKAVPTKKLPDSDIALLRVEDTRALKCGAKWKAPAGVDSALDNAEFVLGVKQNSNGKRTRNRFFLESSTADEIELSPFSKRDEIKTGDSGSTLYVNNKVVGMLLSYDTDRGIGKAIPQGHLYGLLSAELAADRKPLVALVPVTIGRVQNAYATTAVRNLLTKSDKVQLVDAGFDSRTAEPVVPDMAEFVLVTRIIDVAYERIENKNYKRESERESSGLKRFGDGLLGRNENERYFTKYLIDIETEIHNLETKTVTRNLLQQPVQINKGRSAQTDKEATFQATGLMVQQTLKQSEYAHWLAAPKPLKIKNPFKGWFGKKNKETEE